MVETRTTRQIEADKLDLKLFVLSGRLADFARLMGDPAVDDASRIVFGLRGRVQRHMRKADITDAGRAALKAEER